MDVEGGIKAGQDFEREVSACDVMLVLIGPDWLTATDERGSRRLENPEDFVRIEVESALRLGKRVIPVLVQQTEMPRADALPDPLKQLARRHAVGLTPERFKPDVQGLIKELEGALAEVEGTRGQDKTKAAAAEKQRAAEEAAKAEETARAGRNAATAGLSPEQIAKAEELANWDFIKASEKVEDFRDHLARFPQGVSQRWARAKLEALVWAGLPRPIDKDALNGFLSEFPNGVHASEANAKLAELEAAAHDKRGIDPGGSASGAETATALEAARMRIETGLIRTFTGHSKWVRSVSFSPDGRSALSASEDRTLKLWDLATGNEIRSFTGHGAELSSVAFSPDGRFALSGGWDKTLKLWDVATGKEIRPFTGHSETVFSVAISPDGRYALSGSEDKTLKLWDVATGKKIRSFNGHKHTADSVAFSPDGRTALSGSTDKTLKLWDVATKREIWDVATRREIRVLTGHTGMVNSVAFSPNGQTALSASQDETLKLWDVATGKEIRTFVGHSDRVFSVAFSPDGRSALSGSEDKTLKLWDLTDPRE